MSSVMLSSQRGHTEIVSHLLSLKGKCDINAVTPENKSTCLHLAVKRSHFETIKALLREGADIFKKDKKGKTPGEKVKEDGDPRVKSLVNFQVRNYGHTKYSNALCLTHLLHSSLSLR